jgi:AcrR family transcriptional regulator
MSPRPRKVSDDEVFAAAYRAINRLPPSELTLAEIAAEAGVTAGALAQRFGSKRELLLALSQGAAGAAEGFIDQLRAKHRSPIAALRDYAACLAQLAASPAAMARNLAYLQIDLADPAFRRHLLTNARGTRAGLERLVAEAVAAGELASATDAPALARTIEAVLGGSMLTWAIYREATAERWMRDDLEAVLAPHLAKRRRNTR